MVRKKKIVAFLVMSLAAMSLGFGIHTQITQAAAQTFTVNSVADAGDANTADGICETATPGQCTLRAAIEQANANGNPSDIDVIQFNITGAGVHTITPASLYHILEPVTINGYSQPGSAANSAVWPAALNGTLQIEIDASNQLQDEGTLYFESSASGSTVKGLVINNSPSATIYSFSGTSNIHIEGNYLNTDPSGLIAKWKPSSAVAIQSLGGAIIGGTTPEKRNVITGNKGALNTSANSKVKGNNIFVGSDSVTPLAPNPDLLVLAGVPAVALSGQNIEFGGINEGEGNTVENHTGYGAVVVSSATDVLVAGNRIMGNSAGLVIRSSSNVTVGGSAQYAKNIISGNQTNANASGQAIALDSVNTINIRGNYIGLADDGVTAMGNTGAAISGNDLNHVVIGGAAAGDRNVIGNNGDGVTLAGDDIDIKGNYIGVAADGVTAAGNDGFGARVSSADTVKIGGENAGEANVIGFNGLQGVYLYNVTNSLTKGNYIGVAADGVTPAGNGSDGIATDMGSTNLIGGENAGEANIVANNGGSGVAIGSVGTSILHNKIYDNAALGIDLGFDGVTPNDELDTDTGPNDALNYPTLLVPIVGGGNTSITYRLDVPAGTYRIEFYSNSTADPSGHGEGESYIGSDTVVSSGAGPQLFTTSFVGASFANISSTATYVDGASPTGYGATSEFSGAPVNKSDIEVSKTIVDQDTITTNGTIDYQVTFKNNGPDPVNLTNYAVDPGDPLNTALFNDIFPANLTLSSVTGSDIDCSGQNNASTFGSLFGAHSSFRVASCSYTGSNTAFASGQSLSFTLHFAVADKKLNQFTNYLLNVPRSDDADSDAYEVAVNSGGDILETLGASINNLVSAATTRPSTDLSITKVLNNPEDVQPGIGSTLNYSLTVTNHGPDPLLMDDGEYNVPFGSNALIVDMVHPDITPVNTGVTGPFPGTFYVNSGNSDLTCVWAVHGSLSMMMAAAVNSDYGMVLCWYTGATGYLANGATITANIPMEIDSGSNLAFSNYALVNPPVASDEPDEAAAAAITGEPDMLEALKAMNPAINNFATARNPADLHVSAQLVQPVDMRVGSTIQYEVTLTNRGPGTYDVSSYNQYSNGVLGGAFDASVLTLSGSDNPNISCIDAGANSISGWGPGAADHQNHQLFACASAGSNASIPPGGSFTWRINFVLTELPTNPLSFYAANASAPNDQDISSIISAFYGSSQDVLDTLENDNFARVAYVAASGGADTSTSSSDGSGGALSNTGQDRIRFMIAGLFLISVSTVVFVIRRRLAKHQSTTSR